MISRTEGGRRKSSKRPQRTRAAPIGSRVRSSTLAGQQVVAGSTHRPIESSLHAGAGDSPAVHGLQRGPGLLPSRPSIALHRSISSQGELVRAVSRGAWALALVRLTHAAPALRIAADVMLGVLMVLQRGE